MPDFRIYYRLALPAEKKILEDAIIGTKYFGLSIGSNVAAYGTTWVSQFIRDTKKPFFIDPMTYAFQTDQETIMKNGELKKSFLKLSEIYGISDIIDGEQRELSPSDFTNSFLERLTENALNFQRDFIKASSPTQKTILEYEEWLKESDSELTNGELLDFLVAPYFYFESVEEEWYEINLRLIEQALKHKGNEKLYSVICTSKESILDEDFVKIISNDFSKTDGVIIFVSDFDERSIHANHIKSMIQLISSLNSKDILQMYGGYFSIVFSKLGLKGMSPGVAISASKNIQEGATGGGNPLRYYIPEARFLAVDLDARSFYMDNQDVLCDCEVCSNLLSETKGNINEFFRKMSREDAKKHFCIWKDREVSFISKSSIKQIKEDLRRDIEFCEGRIRGRYKIGYKHLKRLLEALENVY